MSDLSADPGEGLLLSTGGSRAKEENRGLSEMSFTPSDSCAENAFFPCTKGRTHGKDRNGEAMSKSVQENLSENLRIPRKSFVWHRLPGFLGM